MKVIKGSKSGIGGGIIDHVGAETGRGVGKKPLNQWRVEIGSLPLAEQKTRIHGRLHDYQGSAIRRDDTAVTGFRV